MVHSGNNIDLIKIDTNPPYFNFQNFIFKWNFDDGIKSDDKFLKTVLFTIYLSMISDYSTVDLSDSVVFIGGYETKRIVAKFNGNEWSRLPDLKQGRYDHGSIQINGKSFIIGGRTDDDKE